MLKATYLLCALIGLSSAAYAAVAEPHYKWQKTNITTCWVDGEMDIDSFSEYHRQRLALALEGKTSILPRTKSRLQNLINREFTPARTGIHFTGWKSCDETKNPDLKIIPINSNATPLGRAPIGRSYTSDNLDNGGFLRGSSYLYLNFRADRSGSLIDPFEDIEVTFLHEMGHVAGLRHEHTHPEAKADPACPSNYLAEPLSSRSRVYSAYDPNSIMNYCFLDTVAHNSVIDQSSTILWVEDDQIAHWVDGSIFQRTNHKWSKGGPITSLPDPQRSRQTYKINVTLSRGDLHGLRCLYSYSGQQRGQYCHQSAQTNL